MNSSVRIPLPAQAAVEAPSKQVSSKQVPGKQVPFSMEQRPNMLLLAAHEPWERLRLMRLDGTLMRECSHMRQVSWSLESVPVGIYWVVAEWLGQRSSRAVVID